MRTKMNIFTKVITAIAFLIAMGINTKSYAAANKVSGAPTSSAQIGTVYAGTPGSVTYTITLPCNAASGAGSTGLAYAWTTGSPTGVTFSPTTQALGASLASVQYTLTVTTNATTVAGTYTFTITTNSNAFTSANITLTVVNCTATVPFTEGFESGFTDNTNIGGCWTQSSVTGAATWKANSSQTTYNRTPRTGTFNATLYYGNEDWLFRAISLTGGTTYVFSMYARQDGATSANANIVVSYGNSATPAAMTNSIVPSTGIINGAYQQITGNFTPSVTGTYYIGIKGYINSTPWYISIDDISITVPTCNNPSALSASSITINSAALNWTENGTATLWDIELGTNGFSPTGTPTKNDITKPYVYTGLNAGTAYSYYVRSDCGGLQSSWIGPFNFSTTACNVQTPSAGTASNVSGSTANLGWTENGNAIMWDIELGLDGFTPTGTPTYNDVTNNPYSLSGLSLTTAYDFYVRSVCGSNSSWVGPFSFTTTAVTSNYVSELSEGWARGVVQGSDGNYLFVGSNNNNGGDVQIVKTTTNGGIIWKKTMGESGQEIAYDVVNSGDGGYVVLSHTNSSSLSCSGGSNYDIMVTKIASDATHVWTRVIGVTTTTEYATNATIIRNSDGTYSLTGTFDTNKDMAFIHLASDGTVLANKELSLRTGANGYSIIQTTDGGWAVGGKYNFNAKSEYFIVKISSTYVLQWSMVWGDNTGTNEYLYTLVENSANDYTAFGSTYAQGTTPANMYAMRFTNSGAGPTVSWCKTYGQGEGATIYDAKITNDGNYIVTGVYSAMGGGAKSDTYVMKINASDGTIIWQSAKLDDGVDNREGDAVIEDSDGNFVVAGLGGFDMIKFSSGGSICDGAAGAMATDNIGSGALPNLINNTEGQSTNMFGSTDVSKTPTISDYGLFVEGCNITLPVELLYLTGYNKDEENILKWATASEMNNDYFAVESSLDLEIWSNIGKVPGAGNSNSILNYSYTDKEPFAGTTYYRLKQTDYDGNFEYSNVVAISKTEDTNSTVKVFPNPFSQAFCIKFSFEPETDYTVDVINFIGQKVKDLKITAGSFMTNVNVDYLPDGLYYIKISNDRATYIKKVVRESK